MMTTKYRLLALLLIPAAFACGGARRPDAPAPIPAPPSVAIEQPQVTTLAEARALRTSGDAAGYERGLQSLTQSTDAVTAARATALLGLYFHDAKRFDEAATTLTRAARLSPDVAPFLLLRVADARRAQQRFRDAIDIENSIIAQAPNTSAATLAQLRLPALHALAGDTAGTEDALARTNNIAIDELTEPDFVDLGAQLVNAHRLDLATRLRLRLLTQYPQGRYTEKTYGQLTQATPSPLDTLTFDDSVRLATKLAQSDRYDQALDVLHRIELRFPANADAAAYRTIRTRALFNSRRYNELLTDTATIPPTDPALILMRARAAWRAGKPEEFLAGLTLLTTKFPASKEATEAKVLRAKYYVTDVTDYAASVRELQSAIAAGAVGNEGENLWNLGWTYTLWQHDDDALRTFSDYARRFPDGDYLTNSLFWSGKIHERHNRIPERDVAFTQLMQKYPYSYYAYRARELMHIPTTAPNEVDNGNFFPDLEASLTVANEPRLAGVRELEWLGLMKDATREMKLVAAAHPDNAGISFMLADVYTAGGEPYKANGILQRHFREFVRHGGRNVPQRFWEILFPLHYFNSFRTAAQARSIDPYVLVSITRQESGFEPTSVSNAGAVGLMQIMPEEASRIATLAGLEAKPREALFDPTYNIQVGAAEYSQKLQAMHDNPYLAVAAYNAGPEAVTRWLAQTPADDIDLFIDSIPYAETKLYVKSVTRNRFEYQRIYGHASNEQAVTSTGR
jgi:soluble lytic murein transglycosylase-like protein/TolA-binding protein